jgi:hypothetical protein
VSVYYYAVCHPCKECLHVGDHRVSLYLDEGPLMTAFNEFVQAHINCDGALQILKEGWEGDLDYKRVGESDDD